MNTQFIHNIQKYGGKEIPHNMQERLNVPLKTVLPKGHKEYYKTVLELITKQKINLHSISPILHKEVYDALHQKAQGVVDLAGANILHLLRYLANLVSEGYHETLQMKHLVEQIWQIKEKTEQQYGDVFII